MSDPVWRVHVLIPARDEEERLGACLSAIGRSVRAAREQRPDVAYDVTVVLDTCTDRSAEIAASFPGVRLLEGAYGSAGAARAAGAAVLPRKDGRALLLSTDADSVVPVSWVTGHVLLAERGHALVVGTVVPARHEVAPRRLARWLARHHLVDGHPHVHGANLGVELAAYDTVGGFRALPTGEDVDLVERVRTAGYPSLATSLVPVTTSGRLRGRAPDGFAAYLKALPST